MVTVECPRCHRMGSLHRKWVLNKIKKRYEPYYYVAHYSAKKRGIRWCYVPKAVGEAMYEALPNTEGKGSGPQRSQLKRE